ncbi:unnamed protein product [Somion occarium]|uniref:Uncharacterized protein n=1 Tax=Somion occarium TaxID=3059160 RepID=A0ABP1E1F7_9APHY
MSRGNKDAASGILNNSMRSNYSEYGVDEYYKKVGATYRNPHFPGVRQCLFQWLNKWWEYEHEKLGGELFTIFDMASGSGEVTVAFMEWWLLGKASTPNTATQQPTHIAIQKRPAISAPSIPSNVTTPRILAADPYTAEAYEARTRLQCAPLSFQDIAEGALPHVKPKTVAPTSNDISPELSSLEADTLDVPVIEMVICSFALHLIENPSELFSLLWELSTKCRWLVVLAPHKKPEIKPGWGWMKWDVETWSECLMTQSTGEFLKDRVHCRVYRSLKYQ